MTAPRYRYRSSRRPGRPAGSVRDVDEAKVFRALGGERVELTAGERREVVRRSARVQTNELALRLNVSFRSVQRIRAALREESHG